jgi:hypothetical protein
VLVPFAFISLRQFVSFISLMGLITIRIAGIDMGEDRIESLFYLLFYYLLLLFYYYYYYFVLFPRGEMG